MLVTEWDYDLEKKVLQKEAREDEAIKIAKNLRAQGMGVDNIAEATGLTVDDILRL